MNRLHPAGRCARLLLALSAASTAALIADAGLATAQNATATPPADEIIVSATGRPTPAREVASSVTVITAQDIEAQQRRTLVDALMTVPGINVVQTGGPGGQTSIFMRGTNSNHVKVLIDGIPAGDPSTPNGAFDFGLMLTGDIERIEVLRGPQSGLYGSDAIGGVISITTKRGEGPPRVTATVEGGSHGTFSQQLGVSGGNERIDYSFNATHFRADGVQVTPPGIVPPGGRINPNAYNTYNLSGRFGIALTETLRLNVIGRYIDGRLMSTNDIYAFPASYPSPYRSQTDYTQAFTRAEAVWDPMAGRFVNRFGVTYSNQYRLYYSPNATGQFGAPQSYLGERIRADWRGDLEIARGHMLIMGLQAERERAETQTAYSSLRAANGNRAGFVEYQGTIAERFFLAANARYDNNDTFGGHGTYRIAPAFVVPGTETRLKASYGTGFRAPSLSELYDPTYGNPALRPEQSRGWDIGFEQPLFNRRIVFGATWFHNDIDNLITTANIGGIWTYQNVNKATTRGLETFAAFEVAPQLRLRADYTYTIARDEILQQDLLRRPTHKASLTATWLPTDALTVSATLLYVSSFWDYDRTTYARVNTAGAATLNLAVSYRATDRVTVFGRLDNLFNKRWENPNGFLQPGFGVFGGIRVAVGG